MDRSLGSCQHLYALYSLATSSPSNLSRLPQANSHSARVVKLASFIRESTKVSGIWNFKICLWHHLLAVSKSTSYWMFSHILMILIISSIIIIGFISIAGNHLLGQFFMNPPPHLLTRPQRDPGKSRDPGIDLESRSRDFGKSNPGIFRDLSYQTKQWFQRL